MTDTFRGRFAEAGFSPIRMVQIPNEYWPEPYVLERLSTPWFEVTADIGCSGDRVRSVQALRTLFPGTTVAHALKVVDGLTAFVLHELVCQARFHHPFLGRAATG